MTEYGTIKIPRSKYEHHNEKRKQLGATWLEYIEGNAPEQAQPELSDADKEEIAKRVGQQASENFDIDAEALAEQIQVGEQNSIKDVSDLVEEISRLKRLVENIPERTAEEVGSKYA